MCPALAFAAIWEWTSRWSLCVYPPLCNSVLQNKNKSLWFDCDPKFMHEMAQYWKRGPSEVTKSPPVWLDESYYLDYGVHYKGREFSPLFLSCTLSSSFPCSSRVVSFTMLSSRKILTLYKPFTLDLQGSGRISQIDICWLWFAQSAALNYSGKKWTD